jgi:hypothetical protein
MDFTAQLSTADLTRIARKFGLTARELSKAAAGAVNDIAITGRGRIRKEVRAQLTLPARTVNNRVRIAYRASPVALSAGIRIDAGRGDDFSEVSFGQNKGGRGRPSLMSYKGRPKTPDYGRGRTKKGRAKKRRQFSYQILKTGPRKTFGKAFVAKVTEGFGKGVIQAFIRRGEDRYPLLVPRGPSIAALWQNPQTGIAKDVMSDLNKRLPSRVEGRAQLILDKHFREKASPKPTFRYLFP